MAYFLKSNYADHLALLAEVDGLDSLRRACGNTLAVPEVRQISDRQLSLQRIDSVPFGDQHWRLLGQGLAALHTVPQSSYGYERNNMIGANPQPNAVSDDWGRFIVQWRLQYQIEQIDDRRTRSDFRAALSSCSDRLAQWLCCHTPSPSLLHGDLWQGNVLASADGRVWLIDPAVYRGDAEADLAMTELFGGFGQAFYAAYHQRRPPSAVYDSKRQIYNLYHLLNHYNLFGGAYLSECRRHIEFVADGQWD